MFQQRSVWCHVWTCPTHRCTSRTICEHTSSGYDVISGNARSHRRPLHIEIRHRIVQTVEPVHPSVTELDIVATLIEDHFDHRPQQSRILARGDLEMDVGQYGGLGAARIDHDEFVAALLRLLQCRQGVDERRSACLAEHGHHNIGTDHQRHVGRGPPLHARSPRTQTQRGHELARLINGDRRVERRRLGGPVKRPDHRVGSRVLERCGSAVRRHGPGSMLVDQGHQALGNFVEGLRRRYRCERAVGAALECRP